MSVLSRRSFLGGATLGAAALAGSPLAAFASTKVPAKWDETTSFLIIGTGFAGLAAALEAHGLGMKANEIMVVDKMPSPGGNSIINGGAVAAAGTDMQKAEGIKDNPDLLFADIVKAGGGSSPTSSRPAAVSLIRRSPAASPTNPLKTSTGCATRSASSSRPSPSTAVTPSSAPTP